MVCASRPPRSSPPLLRRHRMVQPDKAHVFSQSPAIIANYVPRVAPPGWPQLYLGSASRVTLRWKGGGKSGSKLTRAICFIADLIDEIELWWKKRRPIADGERSKKACQGGRNWWNFKWVITHIGWLKLGRCSLTVLTLFFGELPVKRWYMIR